MTTARDLLTVTMDMPSTQPVERGDLSLALAGAEVVDLLRLRAVTLRRDRLVPGTPGPDRGPAARRGVASLVRQAPYETVEDWLWRRGRGCRPRIWPPSRTEGQLTRQRQRRWLVFGGSQMVLVDSPGRRRAAHRWAADEPVLTALATSIGVSGAVDAGPIRPRADADPAPRRRRCPTTPPPPCWPPSARP